MGLLRLILAVSVVMYHSNGFFRYSIASGDAAVQVFFMISGFLIALVLEGKYATRGSARIFYGNRLLRIYPSYLACLCLTMLVASITYVYGRGYFSFVEELRGQMSLWVVIYLVVSAITVVGQEIILFFIASPQGLALSGTHLDARVYLLQPLPQAWSLSFELMFYLLAPLFARLRTRWLVAWIGLLLAVKIVIAASGHVQEPIAHRFFPTSLPMFLLGSLAFRLRKTLVPTASAARRIGAGFLLVTFVVSPLQFAALRAGGSTEWVDSVYYVLAFFGIPALFAISDTLRDPRLRRWDARLGELSYPIYICHLIVTGIVATVLPQPGIVWDAIRCAINVPATLPLALALVVGIERPVERYRASRIRQYKARLTDADVVDITYPA